MHSMIQLGSRKRTPVMTQLIEHTKPVERTKPVEQTQPVEKALEPSSLAKATPVTSRVCHWLTPILYLLGRRIVMPFYFRRLKVTGQENIPRTGALILAPTHRSRWDALVIPYAVGKPVTNRDFRYMVSEDEMKGIQGWFIRRMGGFPVNTRHPGVGSFRHSIELLRNGEGLVIFPEGNIYRDFQPLKPGIGRIALQAQASQSGMDLAIVPISIHYSSPIPHWRCEVTVTIGTPIKVANYGTKSAKKGAQQLTYDLEMAMRNLDEGKTLTDLRVSKP
jgi:1-acyl-sn-glycerol-3-phosphate acyltransferase